MNYKQWLDTIAEIRKAEGEESAKGYIYKSLESKKLLPFFGRYFFPHIIQGKEDTPEAHLDLITEMNRREDGAIVFPRGFAKSTWEKIDTLHDIVYALEPVILYIGNTIDEAGKHFESIKTELENNLLLQYIYGDLVPSESSIGRKWTNKHFETTNEVNLVARGAGKGRGVNIKNNRPTKIIIDDGEDDEMVASKDRRMKYERWIYNVVMPSKDAQRGYVKMIGTVISPHCQILKFYKRHGGIFRKAIEDGKSIWPYMWPIEKLIAKKEEIGSRPFAQEYQNTPITDETSIIKKEWLFDNFYDAMNQERATEVAICLDPQAGSSADADFYGLAVAARYVKDNHKYLLRLQTGKGRQIEQAALFVKTYQEFNNQDHIRIRFAGIEKVMTQVAVYQLVLDWKNGVIDFKDFGVNDDDRNINFGPLFPDGKEGGKFKDKVARLQMFESDFERGELHLHHTMTAFADKLTCFPEVEHDDDCFVAGTIVATPKGNKPIETIKKGDMVITPFGISRVKATRARQQQVIQHKYFTGTPSHKIFTHNKGFVEMDSLMYDDGISTLSFYSLFLWKIRRSFISEVLNINLWGRENITYLNQKQMKVGKELKDFILQSGNITTTKKLQKVFIFIIKTVIHSIIILKIWSVWRLASTYQDIARKGLKMKSFIKDKWSILTGLDHSQRNGMLLMRGGSGIKIMQRYLSAIYQLTYIFVQNVAQNMRIQKSSLPFVQESATKENEEGQALIWFAKNAQFANRNLKQINIGQTKPAQDHAPTGQEVVYNLSVEEGVYYANNILVSNCDAFIYALESLHKNQDLPQQNENVYNEDRKEAASFGNIEKQQF